MSKAPAPSRASPAGQLSVHLSRATRRGWVPATRALRRWAALALGRKGLGRELSVLVVGSARSQSLNRRYRHRDYPTNVLSFAPAAPGPLLGDLVICPEVLQREAREQGKAVSAHWTHLVVHGVLHLIGYDHGRPRDARRMERREVRVMRSLGLPNPYRSH